MRTSTTISFEVSDVVRATEPLPEVPYKQSVEALLTSASPMGARGGRQGRPPRRAAPGPPGRSLRSLPRPPAGPGPPPPVRRRRPQSLHGAPPSVPVARHDLAADRPRRGQPHQCPSRRVAASARQAHGATDTLRATGRLRQGLAREPLAGGLRRVLGADPPACRPRPGPVSARLLDHRAGGAGRLGGRPAGCPAVLLRLRGHDALRHPGDHAGGHARGLAGRGRAGTLLRRARLGLVAGVAGAGPGPVRSGIPGRGRSPVLAVALPAARRERGPVDHGLDHGVLPLPEGRADGTGHEAESLADRGVAADPDR